MTYKLVAGFVSSVIKTIQATAIAQTRTLRKSTFNTEVKNFPKTQSVKGTVTVGNQKNVEKQLRSVEKHLKTLSKDIQSIKIPDKVSVNNFPEHQKFPEYPSTIEVSNPVKEVKIRNTKDLTSIRVLNQPVEQIEALGVMITQLSKDIRAIKLDPKINVQSPEVVIPETKFPKFPEFPEQMTAKQLAEEVFHNNPKNPLPVRLSDGKKFYRAIDEMVTTMSSGASSSFITADGKPSKALVDPLGRLVVATQENYNIVNAIDNGGTEYVSYQRSSGDWAIARFIVDGTLTTARYATIINNPTVETHDDAWDNRETLTYETPQSAQY